MANPLDNIVPFIQKNALLIIGVIIVAAILVFILTRNRKKELKPINRAEIERIKFIERMDLNKTTYTDIYRGNEWMGKILRLRHRNLSDFKKLKSDEKNEDVLEIVIKPSFINLGFVKLAIGKNKCVIVRTSNLIRDRARRFIEILDITEFDNYLGQNYDIGIKDEAVEYIKADSQFRTDWESMASIYYAKAQEQCIYNPQYANEQLKKQTDLEIEKEKRSRLVTGG